MVAACISAETGVGPAMASGSHTERELGALSHRPEEEEDGTHKGDTGYGGCALRCRGVDLLDAEGAEGGPQTMVPMVSPMSATRLV